MTRGLNKVRRASSRRRLSNEESLFTGRGGGREGEGDTDTRQETRSNEGGAAEEDAAAVAN